MSIKIKRALLSVSSKIGIIKFAEALQSFGVELISTGGTYKQLLDAGIKVKRIEELTNFPEMLNGRLKTLHPFVHGGILANRSIEEHLSQVNSMGIKLIDMVVVNLYPFKETISKPDVTLEEAIENIDIGGPTMLRSAAKNSRNVAAVVDPQDYELITEELNASGGELSQATLFKLCAKAFQHTCEYDSVIFNYLLKKYEEKKEMDYSGSDVYIKPYLKIDCTKVENDFIGDTSSNYFKDEAGGFTKHLNLDYEKISDLRYGENPHQKAAYYKIGNAGPECFANSVQLQGKELSYNNIMDANSAFAIVKEFDEPCVAVIKHNNPCGVALSSTVTQAYHDAHFCDPVSAFGSIVASNFKWTSDAARFLQDKFVEVLIAPDFEDEALEILKKKENLRILKIGFNSDEYKDKIKNASFKQYDVDIKSIDGGLLVQDIDTAMSGSETYDFATTLKPSRSQIEDLLFAWQVSKNVKSNAIVLVKGRMTVGIGAGQMSRVDATKIAIEKAGERAKGSVLASDAFFPFGDAVEAAIDAGVKAIIQPGGSVKDKEVIEICERLKVPMLFTGKRHFRH